MYIDRQPVPGKALELDFEAGSYIRAYHSLFTGFHEDKGTIQLTREDFSRGSTLFSFNLSADLCSGPHLCLQHQGNLRLEIKFSKALQKPISVLIYAEFENVIEIAKSCHILCDFAN